jgi:hypothetical protein
VRQSEIEFFRPLWRRVAVTAFCGIWCALEWYWNEPFWGMVTGAAFAFCLFSFFLTFPKDGGGAEPKA